MVGLGLPSGLVSCIVHLVEFHRQLKLVLQCHHTHTKQQESTSDRTTSLPPPISVQVDTRGFSLSPSPPLHRLNRPPVQIVGALPGSTELPMKCTPQLASRTRVRRDVDKRAHLSGDIGPMKGEPPREPTCTPARRARAEGLGSAGGRCGSCVLLAWSLVVAVVGASGWCTARGGSRSSERI